jgi:IMP dehydrogenase
MNAVNQVKQMVALLPKDVQYVVGNFATGRSINDFLYHLGSKKYVGAFKVGIGPGSACTTRITTGVGSTTFSGLVDCVSTGVDVIADGGISDAGSFAKCLAIGTKAVMLGGMLAGCYESPGEVLDEPTSFLISSNHITKRWKKYRGSASGESYGVQGKTASHRTPEGESFQVPYTGPVAHTLQKLEAGLRSCMSYMNANTLSELRENAEWQEITNAGQIESGAHGKKNG